MVQNLMPTMGALPCFGESCKPGVVAAAVDHFSVARGAVGIGTVAAGTITNIHILQMSARQRI